MSRVASSDLEYRAGTHATLAPWGPRAIRFWDFQVDRALRTIHGRPTAVDPSLLAAIRALGVSSRP